MRRLNPVIYAKIVNQFLVKYRSRPGVGNIARGSRELKLILLLVARRCFRWRDGASMVDVRGVVPAIQW
jgi:hypothetical protein